MHIISDIKVFVTWFISKWTKLPSYISWVFKKNTLISAFKLLPLTSLPSLIFPLSRRNNFSETHFFPVPCQTGGLAATVKDHKRSCPLSGATSACGERLFPSLHHSQTTRLGLDWRTGKFTAPLPYFAFYRNPSSTSFLDLILLLTDPTDCSPLISLRDFSECQTSKPLMAKLFPFLKSSTSSTENFHVTCPCNKLHTTTKSFITSYMKTLK